MTLAWREKFWCSRPDFGTLGSGCRRLAQGMVGKQATFQASGFHSARRQVWASGAEGSGSLDSTLVTVGTPDGGFLGGQQGRQAALSCDLWATEAVGRVSFCEHSA